VNTASTQLRRRPAYANRLLGLRQRGQHPGGVQVVVADGPWARDKDFLWPHVWLGPADCQPGRYDWSVVAGLPVLLICVLQAPLFEIAAEISDLAAWVWIPHLDQDLVECAAVARYVDPQRAWPAWWSAERHLRALANYRRWRSETLPWLAHGLSQRGRIEPCTA
jgi:hypothetical protein